MKKDHITIKDLPKSERPYEKALQNGIASLSDAELLAVIIRTGSEKERCVEVAAKLLCAHREFHGLAGLMHLTFPDLTRIHGIGPVKAIQIQAISELTKRISRATMEDMLYFETPDAIAAYYMQELCHLEVEQVFLMMLNAKSKLIRDMEISRGTVNRSLISPREILIEALRYNAVFIILVHNHPSGDPTPSEADLLMTSRLSEAAALIGIRLMDHVILGNNRFISLKQKGFL